MRIGFALPLHGSAARSDGLITIAKRAEAMGYESLWVWERLAGTGQTESALSPR